MHVVLNCFFFSENGEVCCIKYIPKKKSQRPGPERVLLTGAIIPLKSMRCAPGSWRC